MKTTLRPTVLLLLAVFGLLASLPAAAYTHNICVAVRINTTDSDIGEDYFASPTGQINNPARWAKMRVKRGASTLVATHYTGYDGCVSFESPYTTGFTLTMWGEAEIPRTDNPANTNLLRIRYSNGNIPTWTWNFSSQGTGVKWLLTNQSRRTNLLGLSTFILGRWSDGLVNKTFTVHDKACETAPNNSCNNQGTGNVFIHRDHNQKKFVLGHELGHALVSLWVDGLYSASYSINSGGNFCTTSQTPHALHSKEFQSAALNEGFAQFYSTAIWNSMASSTAWFYYYKDYYKNGAVTFVDVENGPTGGVSQYLETRCTGSDAGRGTEIDWQRTLWDYMTNPGTAPSKYGLLRQFKNGIIGGTWSNSNAYYAFSDGVDTYDTQNGTSFLSRWIEMATWNGIDH